MSEPKSMESMRDAKDFYEVRRRRLTFGGRIQSLRVSLAKYDTVLQTGSTNRMSLQQARDAFLQDDDLTHDLVRDGCIQLFEFYDELTTEFQLEKIVREKLIPMIATGNKKFCDELKRYSRRFQKHLPADTYQKLMHTVDRALYHHNMRGLLEAKYKTDKRMNDLQLEYVDIDEKEKEITKLVSSYSDGTHARHGKHAEEATMTSGSGVGSSSGTRKRLKKASSNPRKRIKYSEPEPQAEQVQTKEEKEACGCIELALPLKSSWTFHANGTKPDHCLYVKFPNIAIKSEVKSEVKPEVKSEVKPEIKAEVKVETHAKSQPEADPALEHHVDEQNKEPEITEPQAEESTGTDTDKSTSGVSEPSGDGELEDGELDDEDGILDISQYGIKP